MSSFTNMFQTPRSPVRIPNGRLPRLKNANVQFTVGDGSSEQANMGLSEFTRACKGMKLLSSFLGFRCPNDGLEFYAQRFGVETDAYDTEIDAAHNLADEGL